MSNQGESRIRCPSCGKFAPPMNYCIHCGVKLPQPVPPTVRPPIFDSKNGSIEPKKTNQIQSTTENVEDSLVSLMSDVESLYERKVALLEILQSGQVSEKVFTKLYEEYSERLADLLESRDKKNKEFRKELDTNIDRSKEVTTSIEELKVRHQLGEVSEEMYAQKIRVLKEEEKKVQDASRILSRNLDILERLLKNKESNQIRNLKEKLTGIKDEISKVLEEGKISKMTFNAVKPDIEKTLESINSILKERETKEKNIKEQLEMLETRYKLNEFSKEEYEKRKIELQEKMD